MKPTDIILVGSAQNVGRSLLTAAQNFSNLEARVAEEVASRNAYEHIEFPKMELMPATVGAVDILKEAAECIGDRAEERDTEEERSMAATVRAFNGMFGTELTEEQGWHFMTLLKMSRSKGGEFRHDDYVDGAAYFALAGECRADTQ